jgi:hypothetical protein
MELGLIAFIMTALLCLWKQQSAGFRQDLPTLRHKPNGAGQVKRNVGKPYKQLIILINQFNFQARPGRKNHGLQKNSPY